LTSVANFPVDTKVELEDKTLATTTTMSENDVYSFTTTGGTVTDRFVLHLSSKIATSIDKQPKIAVKIYNVSNTIYVDVPDLKNPVYELIDLNGRTIQSGELQSNVKNCFKTDTKGMVLVKIIYNSGVYTQKVLIN
jgi:hypothetical protein